MHLTDIRVAHAIPGRIRLKIADIRHNPELAWEVEEQLSRVEGVSLVEASPVTASVLVQFGEPQPTPGDSIRVLSAAWPPALGAVDLLHADGRHQVNGSTAGGNGSTAGLAADRHIVGVFRSLNSGVSAATSGIDLKVLVPAGLFLLGIRGLFTDRLPFPAWYDFFWFALSTFVMLNRGVIEEAGHQTPALA